MDQVLKWPRHEWIWSNTPLKLSSQTGRFASAAARCRVERIRMYYFLLFPRRLICWRGIRRGFLITT